MKTIDLDLFNPDPFGIKTKNNTYEVKDINAINELNVLNVQSDVLSRMSNFKLLKWEEVKEWQAIIKKILRDNNQNIEEKEIDDLNPMQTMAVMLGMINYINKKSDILKQAFSDDQKKEMKKAEEEIKKKIINQALLDGEV